MRACHTLNMSHRHALPGTQDAPAEEQSSLGSTLLPLMGLASQHQEGKAQYAQQIVVELLEKFLQVEEAFQVGARQADWGAACQVHNKLMQSEHNAQAGWMAACQVHSKLVQSEHIPCCWVLSLRQHW